MGNSFLRYCQQRYLLNIFGFILIPPFFTEFGRSVGGSFFLHSFRPSLPKNSVSAKIIVAQSLLSRSFFFLATDKKRPPPPRLSFDPSFLSEPCVRVLLQQLRSSIMSLLVSLSRDVAVSSFPDLRRKKFKERRLVSIFSVDSYFVPLSGILK